VGDFFPAKEQFKRPAELQAQVDIETRALTLYQFKACPFCVKVRRVMKRLDLKIALQDAKKPAAAEELQKGGGELQVPCLRVISGDKAQWIYESDNIKAYLVQRFMHP
jgi:glutaredoxin